MPCSIAVSPVTPVSVSIILDQIKGGVKTQARSSIGCSYRIRRRLTSTQCDRVPRRSYTTPEDTIFKCATMGSSRRVGCRFAPAHYDLQ